MDSISEAVGFANTYAWYIAFVFLIGAGIYFLIKLRGMQISTAVEGFKLSLSGIHEGETTKHISSFEAFCVGLGARVGVGNVAGVATALVAGGPGAVFWMWIFAIIGAGTSFMECTLGQMFKEKNEEGLFVGGPAYYIKNGLKNYKFAILLAVLVIALYGVGFIGVQASNATDAIVGAIGTADYKWVIGLGIALAAATIIFGGVKRVAKASSKIVPYLVVAWIVFALITIIINFNQIGAAFYNIIAGAFGIKEFVAGGMGAAIMMGLKRGVFSNEAGIGSVPNISSSANVPHPVKQGLIQSFGVLIDTLVVCSATAFVILTYSGDYFAFGLDGSQLVQEILSQGFLGAAAPAILAIFIVILAFTSLIGYYSMCEANVNFLTKSKTAVTVLRVIIVAVVFISCLISLQLMWDICDTLMAVMGVFNMIAVGLLAKYAFACYKDYRAQKAAGIEEPVFDVSSLEGMDVSGITTWDKN